MAIDWDQEGQQAKPPQAAKPKGIDWASEGVAAATPQPESSVAEELPSPWGGSQSYATGEIRSRRFGPATSALEDFVGDVKHGTGVTMLGRGLQKIPGWHGVEGEQPESVTENPLINPLGAVMTGVPEVYTGFSHASDPRNTLKATAQGANESVGGAFKAAAPALVAAGVSGPGTFLPTLAGFGTAQTAGTKGLISAGMDPDEAEALVNMALIAAPGVKEHIGPAGDFLSKHSRPLGRALGYGVAAAEMAHGTTPNPLWLLTASPAATRVEAHGVDALGKGLSYMGRKSLFPHEIIPGGGRPGPAISRADSGRMMNLNREPLRPLVDVNGGKKPATRTPVRATAMPASAQPSYAPGEDFKVTPKPQPSYGPQKPPQAEPPEAPPPVETQPKPKPNGGAGLAPETSGDLPLTNSGKPDIIKDMGKNEASGPDTSKFEGDIWESLAKDQMPPRPPTGDELVDWNTDSGAPARNPSHSPEERLKELYDYFERNDLLDDRAEYGISDFLDAYPDLTEGEAQKLSDMVEYGPEVHGEGPSGGSEDSYLDRRDAAANKYPVELEKIFRDVLRENGVDPGLWESEPKGIGESEYGDYLEEAMSRLLDNHKDEFPPEEPPLVDTGRGGPEPNKPSGEGSPWGGEELTPHPNEPDPLSGGPDLDTFLDLAKGYLKDNGEGRGFGKDDFVGRFPEQYREIAGKAWDMNISGNDKAPLEDIEYPGKLEGPKSPDYYDYMAKMHSPQQLQDMFDRGIISQEDWNEIGKRLPPQQEGGALDEEIYKRKANTVYDSLPRRDLDELADTYTDANALADALGISPKVADKLFDMLQNHLIDIPKSPEEQQRILEGISDHPEGEQPDSLIDIGTLRNMLRDESNSNKGMQQWARDASERPYDPDTEGIPQSLIEESSEIPEAPRGPQERKEDRDLVDTMQRDLENQGKKSEAIQDIKGWVGNKPGYKKTFEKQGGALSKGETLVKPEDLVEGPGFAEDQPWGGTFDKSADQPGGGPGAMKNRNKVEGTSTEFWHGTKLGFLEDILKDGLKPGDIEGGPYGTLAEEDAHQFAQYGPEHWPKGVWPGEEAVEKEPGIILKFKVPAEWAKDLYGDYDLGRRTIPPSMIDLKSSKIRYPNGRTESLETYLKKKSQEKKPKK
jgi:hypothetical protein